MFLIRRKIPNPLKTPFWNTTKQVHPSTSRLHRARPLCQIKPPSFPVPTVAQSYRYFSTRNHRSKTPRDSSSSKQKFQYFHANHLPQTAQIPLFCPQIPVIATDKLLVFPRFTKTISVTDAQLMDAIRHQIALKQPYAGVFLKRDEKNTSEVVNGLNEIYGVGSFVHIREMKDFGDRITLVVNAVRRVRIINQLADNSNVLKSSDMIPPAVVMVEVDNVEHEKFTQTAEIKAMTQEIVKTFRDIVTTNPMSADLLQQILEENQYVIRDTVYLCDLGASITSTPPSELQKVMEEPNIPKRLMLTLTMLKKEIELSHVQREINKEVEDNVRQLHRKFILMEQIKVIKKELGLEKDDKEAITERFHERIQSKAVPKLVMETIDEEMNKLKMLEGHSADFNVIRNYLDWLTAMPWGIRNEENLDIEHALKVLNAEHYGMLDIKNRILEFIAVSQLRGTTQGKIICFHGPPGVGKTSIARSIAEALNREYFRFSVGGIINSAEIKGHRRTYVGAMPGKIIQGLKTTKSENPIVLIDEIDKIGKGGEFGGGGGDPSAALLELLDPEQNSNFMDFYLDVPVDLSKVLFICTANTVDMIPNVLRDRMELIEMTGYVSEEKIAIAINYLVPRALRESGLTDDNVQFTRAALNTLIHNYSSESGVRTLQKLIEKIVRKIALQIVKGQNPRAHVAVSEQNLAEFLGKTINPMEQLYTVTPPGVVLGLGHTAMGGTVLYIETTKLRSKEINMKNGENLVLTGNLGAVMKESAEIALTVARNLMPENGFFEANKIHVHIPRAAQPKDGPSAGITIVAALQSLALNRSVRQKTAMTGEVSLHGNILPVGGIKEKTIAAKRMGVECIILPQENRHDYEALPRYITEGLEVHFVSHYSDVFKIIFNDK